MQGSFLYWLLLIPALALPSPSDTQDGEFGSLALPRYAVSARRADTSVRVVQAGDTTVFDITSDFGIDQAVVQRLAADWPNKVQVRLNLAGLESFRAGNGKVDVEWSLPSSGDLTARVSLWKGENETVLATDNPYRTVIGIVGGNRKIPLKEGHLEILLPTQLFDQNPREIKLQWVDFFR